MLVHRFACGSEIYVIENNKLSFSNEIGINLGWKGCGLCSVGLQYFCSQHWRTGGNDGNVCRYFHFIHSHQKFHIAKLAFAKKFTKVIVQRAPWIAGELETEHVAAAHIIVDGTTEYVHRIVNNGRCMEHATGWHLRLRLWYNDRPNLRI